MIKRNNGMIKRKKQKAEQNERCQMGETGEHEMQFSAQKY